MSKLVLCLAVPCTHLEQASLVVGIPVGLDLGHISHSKGPATRCDTGHLRWDVLKPMRCIKIACDALRCIFQHVGNFAPDFEISQPIIIRFSNGFYHNAGDLMSFHVICVSNVCVIYF